MAHEIFVDEQLFQDVTYGLTTFIITPAGFEPYSVGDTLYLLVPRPKAPRYEWRSECFEITAVVVGSDDKNEGLKADWVCLAVRKTVFAG